MTHNVMTEQLKAASPEKAAAVQQLREAAALLGIPTAVLLLAELCGEWSANYAANHNPMMSNVCERDQFILYRANEQMSTATT